MVLNKMFHLRYSVVFWICLFLRIYRSGEYNRVLNMSGLHKNLNKRFHDKCFTVIWICGFYWQYFDSEYARALNILVHTWFWIKFCIIDIWQGLEYASTSEYASVTQGSVENGPSYSSGSQYARAWIYIRFKVSWMSWVLNMLKFRMHQESINVIFA